MADHDEAAEADGFNRRDDGIEPFSGIQSIAS
jgi:hypothetical protein